MQHQVSANGRSAINTGITEDYKQAQGASFYCGY